MVDSETWDTLTYVGAFALIGLLVVMVGFHLGKSMNLSAPPSTEPIVGLTVQAVNGTYFHQITNPFNETAKVYFNFLTDPENLSDYVSLSSTVQNGSRIPPLSVVFTEFTVSVEPNSYEELGEIYIKLWCVEQK